MPRLYEMPQYIPATIDLDKVSYVTRPWGAEEKYSIWMDNGTEFNVSNDFISPRYLNRDSFIASWSGE
jgi:hypothetical protein